MTDQYTTHHVTMRSELLQQIMPLLAAGECCALVGVSGVGKSNLVGFLRRPQVQAAYWPDGTTWVLTIDTHGLVFGDQPDAYVVAELMIHRLLMEAERRALPPDLLTWANDLHARLIAQPGAHLALRYLERLCARLCDGLGQQLVFVFDQFEDLWTHMDARFFLNLRYLRDQLKYRLMYLVITRHRLQTLHPDPQSVEAFWELFALHTYGLGMSSPSDAEQMLERIAQRRGTAIDPAIASATLHASGRHPALLRAVFWALSDQATLDPAALLDVSAVAEECAKIWYDLTPAEQAMARTLAAGLPLRQPDATVLAGLRLTEIVVDEPPMLFSPLFARYVQRQGGAGMAGIVVEPQLRQVWLDGQPLARPLSPLEFNLLEYLARHVGNVCRREDILAELYQEAASNTNDERLDTVLRRLREALHEDARNPRYLVTHRGVGIQLTEGGIRH